MMPEQIKANLGTWVQEEAFHTIAGACGDMIRAYDKAAAERDAALKAVHALWSAYRDASGALAMCPRRETGVGGMTIDAQLRRTVHRDVPAMLFEKMEAAEDEHFPVIEAARKMVGESC